MTFRPTRRRLLRDVFVAGLLSAARVYSPVSSGAPHVEWGHVVEVKTWVFDVSCGSAFERPKVCGVWETSMGTTDRWETSVCIGPRCEYETVLDFIRANPADCVIFHGSD